MSRISQTNDFSQVDIISTDGRRINRSPGRIRLGSCDLAPPANTKSTKSSSSRKETIDDKQVLRGAEILREQLLAVTKQRLAQQQNHPLLRSPPQDQQHFLENKISANPSVIPRTGSTYTSVTTKISNTSRIKSTHGSMSKTNDSKYASPRSGHVVDDSTGAIADLCGSMPLQDCTNRSRQMQHQSGNRVPVTEITRDQEGVICSPASSEKSDSLSSATEDFLNDISPTYSALSAGSSSQQYLPLDNYLLKNEKPMPTSDLQRSQQHELAVESKINTNPLSEDKAYQHAILAGMLWQSLVGEQVRFPKSWFNGQRSRPMMSDSTVVKASPWMYISKHRVLSNPFLNQIVPIKRNVSKGRLMLHIVIQDQRTLKPIQDVAVGCFHPKYVHNQKECNGIEDDARDVWMAIRKTGSNSHSSQQSINPAGSLIDSILCVETKWKSNKVNGKKSPLGDQKGLVTNDNVAAIYGDKPPLKTVVMTESDAFKILNDSKKRSANGVSSPAILLLHEFLFKRLSY